MLFFTEVMTLAVCANKSAWILCCQQLKITADIIMIYDPCALSSGSHFIDSRCNKRMVISVWASLLIFKGFAAILKPGLNHTLLPSYLNWEFGWIQSDQTNPDNAFTQRFCWLKGLLGCDEGKSFLYQKGGSLIDYWGNTEWTTDLLHRGLLPRFSLILN